MLLNVAGICQLESTILDEYVLYSLIYFVASIPKSIISLGKKINDFPSDIHMSIYVLAYITQTSWRDPPTNHSKKDT